jgi:hypothetical protein
MRTHLKVEMTVGTLRAMTHEQLDALQANIVGDGQWEHVDESLLAGGRLLISGDGAYLGIHLPSMFVGIEKDGYTHS